MNNTNVTYVVLDEQQSNSLIRNLLSNSPTVSQITVDQVNPYILGGRNIPQEQIRSFRANRLESREVPESMTAYVTNVPESPLADNGVSLHAVLQTAIPEYSQNQILHLQNLGISPISIQESISINSAINAGINELISATVVDISYSNIIFNTISQANSTFSEIPLPQVNHLFFVRNIANFSINLNNQIQSIVLNIHGGPLASRILNIFLVLGLNFMDFVYNRFLELSQNDASRDNNIINISTQLFFVRLRQALSGLFILFLGLEHFISIDLNTFLLAFRSATLSISLIISLVQGYRLLNQSETLNTNVINATRRVENYVAQSNASLTIRLRTYYTIFVHPILLFLRNNPTLSTGMLLFSLSQIPRGGVLLRNLLGASENFIFSETVGPVTRSYRQLTLAIRQFLNNFRNF